MALAATDWLLRFASSNYTAPDGDGRPWGDGTAMAARADPANPRPPWDIGCSVKVFVGGQAAMDAYTAVLNHVIDAASSATTAPFINGAWTRGRVYIADWRFNCLRDVSTNTNAWPAPPGVVDRDNVAIGLVRRLMQAGVQVRLLFWYPKAPIPKSLWPHIADHHYAAQVVKAESQRLMNDVWEVPANADPLGVVALDMRTAEGRASGSLHQKMLVVRTPTIDIAFAGGVDLAYTRRDAPLTYGDWQSGTSMPVPGPTWPRQESVNYSSLAETKPETDRQTDDLPEKDDAGNTIFGARQSWHDQHLQLTGPIVATLEEQFAERWRDTSRVYTESDSAISSFLSGQHLRNGQVIFSTPLALGSDGKTPRRLPAANPVAATGSSTVQMWRTIPWRNSRTGPPFVRAEYTILAGVSQAVSKATELIWIFDQYFWSRSLAVQLHGRLRANPNLRVIAVLPPHQDGVDYTAQVAHRARSIAVDDLINTSGTSVAAQVAVYAVWDSRVRTSPSPPPVPPMETDTHGIYVHAKVQMYDGGLLVCGSANMNRRSFLCDAELAVAIADPAVVAAHQQALWSFLFPSVAWPALDLGVPGNGAKFFEKFTAASGVTAVGQVGPSMLILDPWNLDDPRLPSGAIRKRAPLGVAGQWAFDTYYDSISDPSSLRGACERTVQTPGVNTSTWLALDDVSRLVELPGNPVTWPYRKQA